MGIIDVMKGDKVLVKVGPYTNRVGHVLFVKDDEALVVPVDELIRFWVSVYGLDIIKPAPRPEPPIVYNKCNLCDCGTSQSPIKLSCCRKDIYLCCECKKNKPIRCAACIHYRWSDIRFASSYVINSTYRFR